MNRFCWSKVAVLLLLNILCGTNIARGQLTVNPASVNFGNVLTGTSPSQALILSNSSKSDLTVSQAMVSGPGFSLRGPSLPLTLTSRQNCDSECGVRARIRWQRKRQSLADRFDNLNS